MSEQNKHRSLDQKMLSCLYYPNTSNAISKAIQTYQLSYFPISWPYWLSVGPYCQRPKTSGTTSLSRLHHSSSFDFTFSNPYNLLLSPISTQRYAHLLPKSEPVFSPTPKTPERPTTLSGYLTRPGILGRICRAKLHVKKTDPRSRKEDRKTNCIKMEQILRKGQ